MRSNHVKRRLQAGEPSIGTWLSLPSPEAAEYVSTLPFDWLVVDTEQEPLEHSAARVIDCLVELEYLGSGTNA